MNIKFFHEVKLPGKQYIIVVKTDDKKLVWQSSPNYRDRWRQMPKSVAVTKYSKEIDSSEFPKDKKQDAIEALFSSPYERL